MAGLLSRAAQRSPTLDLTQPVQAQAIVILAGGNAREVAPEYGGEPAANGGLLERVTYGAFLAHRTGLPVLVTGTPTEAQAMRVTLARDFGCRCAGSRTSRATPSTTRSSPRGSCARRASPASCW